MMYKAITICDTSENALLPMKCWREDYKTIAHKANNAICWNLDCSITGFLKD